MQQPVIWYDSWTTLGKMSECEIPCAWRSRPSHPTRWMSLMSSSVSISASSSSSSHLAFTVSFSSLAAEPLYGSHEKCRHQRMTLLGYYELMWSKREERKKTLVMDHKLPPPPPPFFFLLRSDCDLIWVSAPSEVIGASGAKRFLLRLFVLEVRRRGTVKGWNN